MAELRHRGGRVLAGREGLDPVASAARHPGGKAAAEASATLRGMDIFREIEKAFTSHRVSGRLDHALHSWRVRQAGLGGEESLDTLVSACRDAEPAGQQRRDGILIALCREACSGSQDELAGLVLCWLLLPGLVEQFRGLVSGRRGDRDDLAGELLAGMWEGAARIDDSMRHVARHLLRCARRRALRSLKGSTAVADERPVEQARDDRGLPEDMVDDPLARAVDEGVLGAEQVELVLADRASIARVAARWGLTLVAAQQARHRARRRLLAWLQTS